MRRLMKFLHTLGAIGFAGSIMTFLAVLAFAPAPEATSEYVALRVALGGLARWIFFPSLGLVLISGLLAVALTRAYHDAGWVWLKLATGILVFEWSLVAIQGPMQNEALLGTRVLAGESDAGLLGTSLSAERMSLGIMLAVAAFNVVMGIWRPKLFRFERQRAESNGVQS